MLSVSGVPVLVHGGYIVMVTLSRQGARTLTGQLGVFAVLTIALVASSLLTWRYVRARPARAPLVPLALSALYALPLLWFASVLRGQAIGLDAIPTVVLVCATLFASSLLFAYTLGLSFRKDLAQRRRR